MRISIILVVLASAVSVTINKTHDIIHQSSPPPTLATRILGGVNTNIQDIPYQVSIQHDDFHDCGGSIISKYWVLTSAHCVNDIEKEKVTIRSGTTIANSAGSVHEATEIYQHPRFDSLTFDYDIALVQVDPPFRTGTKDEDVIKLPPSKDYKPPRGAMGLISGWGTISAAKKILPVHLQSVKLPVISRRKCQRSYLFLYISDRMLCAGHMKGRQDACQGDSGGPLVTDGILAGIVSWGLGCGTPGYLGVYANVAYFLPWIKSITDV